VDGGVEEDAVAGESLEEGLVKNRIGNGGMMN